MNKSLGELMQTKDSIINGLPNARQLKESYSNLKLIKESVRVGNLRCKPDYAVL